MQPPALAQQVVDFLNSLLTVDRDAVDALIKNRVPCNTAMREHPTVQVDIDETKQARVGLLGILNGLVGVDTDGWGFVTVKYDDDMGIIGFILTPPRKKTDAV